MEETPKHETNREARFIFPDIAEQMGEIKRVAETFSPDHQEAFARALYEQALTAPLVDLTEEMWRDLDNTDSYEIALSGWDRIKEHIDYTNKKTGATRDWEDLKSKMERGQELDAPIVLKYNNNKPHLVSGNTRLMVARALGKRVKVLLVQM